jgi:RNA polymerase sigma-70 factor (ECF subfamily)
MISAERAHGSISNRASPISQRTRAKRSSTIQTTPLSLLERVRARDASAWRRLVDLYQPLVRAWCQRSGLQNADIEDVTQEVFAAAAANLDRFHHDRPDDTFRGWLRIITRNQINLHYRRLQDRPLAAGGSDAWRDLQQVADPLEQDAESDSAEISELYRRALELVRGDFEERTWHAFWLTAIEDRSPTALAQELGMTPATIRQAKSRVLRRLKQEMGELLV